MGGDVPSQLTIGSPLLCGASYASTEAPNTHFVLKKWPEKKILSFDVVPTFSLEDLVILPFNAFIAIS